MIFAFIQEKIRILQLVQVFKENLDLFKIKTKLIILGCNWHSIEFFNIIFDKNYIRFVSYSFNLPFCKMQPNTAHKGCLFG